MELQFRKEQWLKLRTGYLRKMQLIHELDEIEKDSNLVEKKRRLDHELDLVEHIEKEHVKQSSRLFLEVVEQTRPDLLPFLVQLIGSVEQSVKMEDLVHYWIKFYQTILPHLAQILYLRSNSSGLGMLKYLFGQRPTVLITDEIQKIKMLIAKEKHESDSTALKRLSELVHKRWDFKQIDREYALLFKELEHQYNQLLETRKKAAEASLAAEKNLYDWLEKVD